MTIQKYCTHNNNLKAFYVCLIVVAFIVGNVLYISNITLSDEATFTSPTPHHVSPLRRFGGPHQKVLSFCFFGNYKQNFEDFNGIGRNAQLAKLLYPDWVVRLYHNIPDVDEDFNRLEKIERRLNNLDLRYMEDDPCLRNFTGVMNVLWRLCPMIDPLVDVFLSRDLDSRLNVREVHAVQEWMESNLTFHVMRDHTMSIPGGSLGIKVSKKRMLFHTLVEDLVKLGSVPFQYGLDQEILKSLFWDQMKGDILQHDSYSCQKEEFLEHGNVRPWPTQRESNKKMNFVGSYWQMDPADKLCPKVCRPPLHLDWTTC